MKTMLTATAATLAIATALGLGAADPAVARDGVDSLEEFNEATDGDAERPAPSAAAERRDGEVDGYDAEGQVGAQETSIDAVPPKDDGDGRAADLDDPEVTGQETSID